MAKKFKFGLESVLKLRTGKVEDAKSALGKLISLKNKRIDDVLAIEEEKNQIRNQWAVSGKALFAQAHVYNIEHLDKESKKIYEELEKIKKVEEMRRKNLNLALQEEKIMINLKEKKFELYKKEILKEESNFLDEIGNNLYLR